MNLADALKGKTHVVIHHSLTKDSGTVSWNAIRLFHVEQQKWRAIGYHFGIERVADAAGREAVEVLMGRLLHETAAAVKEQHMNDAGVHICVVGNFDEAAPPQDVLEKAVELTAFLCELLKIPTSNVMPHTFFAPYKTCPGSKFNMKAFREAVSKRRQTL